MRHIRYFEWGLMRISRLAAFPLAVTLAAGGMAGAAAGAPVVTNVLATLPAGSQPNSVVIDGASNAYTLNVATSSISKIAPDGSIAPVWAMLPTNSSPRDMVTTTNGMLFTANFGTGTITQVAPDGTVTPVYAALATAAQPRALVLADDGSLFTANSGPGTISKIDPMGVVTTTYASLAPGSAPFDIGRTASGDLYTLNADLTVSKVTAAGIPDRAFATLAAGVDPVGLAVSSTGHIFVLESRIDQIQEFAATGSLVRTIPLPSRGGQIAIDAHDNLFVTLRAAKSVGFLPSGGGALINSVAPLSPGADYSPLAVTSTDTLYAVGLNDPAIVSRISLGAAVTSVPISGSAQTGVPFHATVTASGYEPVTFSLNGKVPAGLSIDPTSGVISGTPTETGSFRFKVIASNVFGDAGQQGAILEISAGPTPTPTPTPAPTPTSTPNTPTAAGTGTTGGTSSSRGVSSATSLAQTGSGYVLPAGLMLLIAAAGATAIIATRRRRV